MHPATFEEFERLAGHGTVVPMVRRIMCDHLTPVLAYRRLVSADTRMAPSFLLESVEGGASVGRYSFLGAQPRLEILAREHEVEIIDHSGGGTQRLHERDPLNVPRRVTAEWRVARDGQPRWMPRCFIGGWVGYAGYDTMRYAEPEKLPFSAAPADDRGLPDLHMGLYASVVVFDHVERVLYAVHHVRVDEHAGAKQAYAAGCRELDTLVKRLETHSVPLRSGEIDMDVAASAASMDSNYIHAAPHPRSFQQAVARCQEYIRAGDAFQVVLSQRFERRTNADPFDIYRSLRVVNPSPYMIYLQARDSILVASSPEILCRCEDGLMTNRPLAGTRRRGSTAQEDAALKDELLADAKERAEHVMLVDLGRNDLGRVCERASIRIERVMDVERYSHVMHLSSTLTGRLRAGLDCWDALRATLPVGTVSGAPKVRAMQIIDELEPTRRGPYAGGIGMVGLNGNMDMAIALRTIVALPDRHSRTPTWVAHLQAGAGIVLDSTPAMEEQETINKAAALARAIDLAERSTE